MTERGRKYVCKNCFLERKVLSTDDMVTYRNDVFRCNTCERKWEVIAVVKERGCWLAVGLTKFKRHRPNNISSASDLKLCTHIKIKGGYGCTKKDCTFPRSTAELELWDQERSREPRDPPSRGEKYRFMICPSIGDCTYKRRCMYAHSDEELKLWLKSIDGADRVEGRVEEQGRRLYQGHGERRPFRTTRKEFDAEFPPLGKSDKQDKSDGELREGVKKLSPSRGIISGTEQGPKNIQESTTEATPMWQKPSTEFEAQAQSAASDGSASSEGNSSPTHRSGVRSPIIDIKEIQVGEYINKGGFGVVYEAKWKEKTVAVKVCPGNLIESVSREVEVLTSLRHHPHVLSFFGIALGSDKISTLIITELATNGSLYSYLHVKLENPTPDQSIGWAQQIADGMQHLHNNDVVHRDLKSANILLASGLLAKICDFGTARTMVNTTNTTQKGTPRWMAPEVQKDVKANINKMCDVFSYGMVLYEIFACKVPYHDIATNGLVSLAVLQGKRPPVPIALPSFMHPLLRDCWKDEPTQRPQFAAIVLAIQTGSY